MDIKGFTSKVLHVDKEKNDIFGSIRMPVYDNVAFEFESARECQLAFEGRRNAHIYTRITNPTVEDFELRVRAVSGAFGVIAVSSGMAAISNTIIALAGSGSNIITTPSIFGNSYSLFDSTLKEWGLETRYADFNYPESLEKLIDEKTRAIFLENITNPQLEVADINAITSVAEKFSVPVIVDSTVTTPYLFRGVEYGVAIEVISSTKYISGGATSVGGVIIDNGNFDWSKNPKLAADADKFGPFAFLFKLRREVYRNLGCPLSPHNAWLQTLGLETLGMRIDKSCKSSLAIAEFLSAYDKVKSVNYPGLKDSPYYEIATKQFKGRYGGILTFNLASKEKCFNFMDSLNIIKRATNLNDNRTLILHPASTIFGEFSAEEKEKMKVPDTLLRLAVGIEDTEDLINDIKQGLDKL